MLERLFPKSWSRLNVFLSYASEHKRIAEEIALTLKNSGHEVFFDKDSLPPGEDFNDRIRSGIRSADRFLFLVSRGALDEGRFTHSELKFAKERWPAPSGNVFPVMLDKSIKPEELPAYLRLVQTISIDGNPTAEIAHEIDKTRRLRPAVKGLLGLVSLAVVAGLAVGGLRMVGPKAEVEFTPPARVDVRPLQAPPERGGPDNWLKSPLALSALQFGYQHVTTAGARAQIEPEQVELIIDGKKFDFEYRYEINLLPNCKEGGWHCARDAKPLRSLAPGEVAQFQSLFRVQPADQLSWEMFTDRIAAAQKAVSVVFTARVRVGQGGKLIGSQVRHECLLDLAKFKTAIAETQKTRGRVPIFMQQACSYK